MNLRKLYLNFWVRNITLYFFMCGLVLAIDYFFITQEELKAAIRGIPNFLVTSLFVFIQIGVHNILLYEMLLKKRKVKEYVFGFLLLWLGFVLLNTYSQFSMASPGDNPLLNIPSVLLTFILGFGMYSIHENIIKKNIIFRKKLVSQEEEIRYLKAQLNPHFLFNALNNLYGIALSQPASTAEKILELSDLLRYQIEASQKEIILLKDEIEYLEKYINYEQNRNVKLNILFTKSGNVGNMMIAPLLLMPFIENAIKFSNETDEPEIKINLLVTKRQISFILVNNYTKNGKKINGTNTGIANTKKRLEMIHENRYELTINDENSKYIVQLNLEL